MLSLWRQQQVVKFKRRSEYCSMQIAGEKSAGAEGIRRAKGAAIVRLLRSVRCDKAVIRCGQPDDGLWLGSVLTEAGLTLADLDKPSGLPGG